VPTDSLENGRRALGTRGPHFGNRWSNRQHMNKRRKAIVTVRSVVNILKFWYGRYEALNEARRIIVKEKLGVDCTEMAGFIM